MTAEYPVAPRIAAPPVWHVDKALLVARKLRPVILPAATQRRYF